MKRGETYWVIIGASCLLVGFRPYAFEPAVAKVALNMAKEVNRSGEMTPMKRVWWPVGGRRKGSRFMHVFKNVVLAACLALPVCASAQAAGYQVSVIGDAANFVGCLALNETAGVGFLAVGDSVALLANSKSLKIAKGDNVSGKWSVDGGAATLYSAKSDTLNTVTIDVPNDAEAVAALTTGKMLAVTNGSNSANFDLEGSGEAFVNLISCMMTKSAQ
jgi:hypothetical protein